jgi:hypothetical protein
MSFDAWRARASLLRYLCALCLPPLAAGCDEAVSGGGVARPDATVAADAAADGGDSTAQPSPIALENQLPGSDGLSGLKEHSGQLSAYASAASVAAGESLQVFVHVDHDQDVQFELYRAGYYQGHGARLIDEGRTLHATPQDGCPPRTDTGLVACHWTPTFEVQTDAAWVSGFYLFKLHSQDGIDALVPLIVRESMARPRAPIVVQASVNTWQAYNLWGGTSLYQNKRSQEQFKAARAQQVSFNRPYDTSAFRKELLFVRFAEQRGYDLAYATNPDLDADAALLHGRKLFVSVWHDEYWSVPEREALDAARDAGTSLLFLSANTGYWRVRYDASERVITCYKSAASDPQQNAPDTTAQFRQPPHERPENELLGIMYGDWSDFTGFPFLVHNPKHWVWQGTGVREHDTLAPIIGTEWDAMVDNTYTPDGLEIVGDSPVVSEVGLPFAHAQASVYYPTPHSFVFAAGSIAFSEGLYGARADVRVQRMTENLFTRAGFQSSSAELPPTAAVVAPGLVAEERVLAGGEQGYRDGLASTARFSSPSGLAADAIGQLYVADTGNALIRKIDAQGNVTTLAGCAPDGSFASQLCFDTPIGVALREDGVLFVSDSGSSQIYQVDVHGNVSLAAGSGQAGSTDADDPKQARFSNPRGITFGPGGVLYVADFGSAAVRALTPGQGVTTVAKGVPMVAGIAAADSGKLYFTSYKQRLGVISEGQVSGWIGAELAPLEGLALARDGVLVADAGNYRVVYVAFDSTNIENVLGDGRYGDAASHVSLPRGIARLGDSWAISDSGHHRILLSTSTHGAVTR